MRVRVCMCVRERMRRRDIETSRECGREIWRPAADAFIISGDNRNVIFLIVYNMRVDFFTSLYRMCMIDVYFYISTGHVHYAYVVHHCPTLATMGTWHT